MRKVFNFIFYIGFLFFGGGFLIAFGQFVLHNGAGDIFSYVKAENVKLAIQTDTLDRKERYIVDYLYIVDEKLYNAREYFYSSYIKEHDVNLEDLYYNLKSATPTYFSNPIP